jgi:Spy/CpxP family protein refolding chaperone
MKLAYLMAFALALPVMGQGMRRGAFDWWDSPVVKDLNLSAEQTQKVQSTVHDSRSKLIDLRAAVQKAELDVEDAFNAENFDTKRATAAVDRLASARAEANRSLAQLSVSLRAVLTTEQWKELQKRHPGMLRGGMGQGNMRPGGPMGRGMRPGAGRRAPNQNRNGVPPADSGTTPPPPPNN